MNDPVKTYTYRGGEKLELTKSADEFVVAAAEDVLKAQGYAAVESVAPAVNRITVSPDALEEEMARARRVAPTHHAYSVTDTDQEFLISDQVLVTFREDVTSDQIDAFMNQYALLMVSQYSDRDFLFQLTNATGMNPVKLVRKLTEEEWSVVELVEHNLNYRMQKYAFQAPTDPEFGRQWHLHTVFQHPQYDPRASSRCLEAWALLDEFGSPDVVIGITDDGCQLNHQDFDSAGKFAGWAYWEKVGPDMVILTPNHLPGADPNKMYVPNQNHGTSCAGVAAAEIDAVLTVGAAPGCRLLPIRWPSEGRRLLFNDAMLLATLNYLADKVDIISNSWGGVPITFYARQVTDRVKELAARGGRRGKGILFVWAAGNENCPIQHDSAVAVPFTNGWAQLTPNPPPEWVGVRAAFRFRNSLVDIPGVLHVAALASTAQRSHYSNYGTGVDICAPSDNSHMYWRRQVPGLPIYTIKGEGNPPLAEFGGTSSATPLVAGIAALVISANPDLTALEVESILKRTASRDLNLQGYPRTPAANYDQNPTWDVSPVQPFDMGDFQNTGSPDGTWSPWFGYGRVDAAAAVAESLRLSAVGHGKKSGEQEGAQMRSAAIDADGRERPTTREISAAEFLIALEQSGVGLQQLVGLPEKKKLELWVEPENVDLPSVDDLIDWIRQEKKKVELELPPNLGYWQKIREARYNELVDRVARDVEAKLRDRR